MAMNLMQAFGTDTEKEREGVWMEIGEDSKLKIARIGNPKYTKEMQFLTKPHRQAIKRNTLSDDKMDTILIEALAKHVLKDWEGIVDENEEEIPYTVEAGIAMMTQIKDFRNYVVELATNSENFKKEEDEEIEKN